MRWAAWQVRINQDLRDGPEILQERETVGEKGRRLPVLPLAPDGLLVLRPVLVYKGP